MKNPLIHIQHVTKEYQSRGTVIHALDNVSMILYEQEIFGLLGINGAGKTTLSSILATLHPPSTGDILFKGNSIYKDITTYRHALGFCPQTQNLDQFLTVEQNLIFAGRYFLLPEDVIHEQAKKLMAQLELIKYASFNVNALSGGTKQRVLIARALMHNPQIIILDEPTVGLDPDIRRKLWAHIRMLKDMGITVILTTHYLDEAEALSDRICVLHKGKVLLIESVSILKEQYGHQTLEDIFVTLVKQQNDSK